MKQIFYAIYMPKLKMLVRHAIHWEDRDAPHFVPVIFNTRAEAERYLMHDQVIREIHIRDSKNMRYYS